MITYKELEIDDVSRIEPLWKELITYLKEKSKLHKQEYVNKTFEGRMKGYYDKISNGYYRILVAKDESKDIAYCLSSITKDKIGEIDSLYINPLYRNKGIGEYLIKDAFMFFDQHQTVKDIVQASEGNEEVLSFYEKQGFFMRYYTLSRNK